MKHISNGIQKDDTIQIYTLPPTFAPSPPNHRRITEPPKTKNDIFDESRREQAENSVEFGKPITISIQYRTQ